MNLTRWWCRGKSLFTIFGLKEFGEIIPFSDGNLTRLMLQSPNTCLRAVKAFDGIIKLRSGNCQRQHHLCHHFVVSKIDQCNVFNSIFIYIRMTQRYETYYLIPLAIWQVSCITGEWAYSLCGEFCRYMSCFRLCKTVNTTTTNIYKSNPRLTPDSRYLEEF